MKDELDQCKRQLRHAAHNCGREAVMWRRKFKNLAYLEAGYAVIFFPVGFFMLCAGGVVGWIFGPLMWVTSTQALFRCRQSLRRSEEAYQEYMELRQQCLDHVTDLEEFEREYRGFESEG